jgi:Tfp pilus assembly pilus retraction ATPase PilT
MTDNIAEVRETEAGGAFYVAGTGPHVRATDQLHAQDIAAAVNRAYQMGKAHARREVRNALGLHDWGGDVTVPPALR